MRYLAPGSSYSPLPAVRWLISSKIPALWSRSRVNDGANKVTRGGKPDLWMDGHTTQHCQPANFGHVQKNGWFRNQRHCIGDHRRLFNIHSSQLYSYQANVKGRGSPRPTNLPSPGARGLENQTKYCSCLQKASFSGPTNFKLPITPTMSRYCWNDFWKCIMK